MSDLRSTFLDHASEMPAPPRTLRPTALLTGAAVLASYVASCLVLGVTPALILSGLGRLWNILLLTVPPSPENWDHLWIYLEALWQTIAIAFVGTSVAAVLALPVGFLAARNVAAGRIVHFIARRALDSVRSIDMLVWALIWINVVGLGPFAGALAIASADFAPLAKLMSEAIEAAERGQVEGVIASGGDRLSVVRFGLLPQVLPIFASQLLYFFESNTRSAAIIGIVGAGGIGFYLSEMLRLLAWQQVSFLIVLVLIAVAAIDAVSRRLRAAIVGLPRG